MGYELVDRHAVRSAAACGASARSLAFSRPLQAAMQLRWGKAGADYQRVINFLLFYFLLQLQACHGGGLTI